MPPIILASGSEIRAELLRRACVPFEVITASVDEEMVKMSMLAEQVSPRDIADALAEAKARKVALKHTDRVVVGCDQVLECAGALLSKPETEADALEQLIALSGARHQLFSAAVIYEDGKPVWRFIGHARLSMHQHGHDWLRSYVSRNWESIRHTVGCYKLEEEGVRLFRQIEGDHFNVLGMPLLELLSYLRLRGTLAT